MLFRVPTCFTLLFLALMSLEMAHVDSLIHIPTTVTRLLGMTTDVSIEFTRFSKLGNFLSRLGMLGPVAMSLISKAGLALGIMGTAATAISFAASDVIGKREQQYYDSNYYNYIPYPSHHNFDHYDPYTHYRRKRSFLTSQNEISISTKTVHDEDLFDLVRHSDPTQCGERLVCELASKPTQKLMHDEVLILELIRSKSEHENYRWKFYRSKFPYERALTNGHRRRNCLSIYDKCPFSSTQMMTFIRLLEDAYIAPMK